jgi:hypothetical protein
MSLKKSAGFGMYVAAGLGWSGVAFILGLVGAHFNRADEFRGPVAEHGVIAFGLPTGFTIEGSQLDAGLVDVALEGHSPGHCREVA